MSDSNIDKKCNWKLPEWSQTPPYPHQEKEPEIPRDTDIIIRQLFSVLSDDIKHLLSKLEFRLIEKLEKLDEIEKQITKLQEMIS